MQGKLRLRWIRALLTPIAIVTAKLVRIENPTDTIAVLRAEDAFNVRGLCAETHVHVPS
jgi:hypothetical protein